MTIAQRYRKVIEEVANCAIAAGRNPEEVRVIAVSKTVGIDGVRDAWDAGASNFGENRPDPLAEKSAELPEAIWHFIGNIQSRRIPEIVSSAHLIHSVHDLRHAQKINDAAQSAGKIQRVLIEVNVSGEESKSGATSLEAPALVLEAAALPHVEVCGLMTMAPQGDREVARGVFARLRQLADDIRLQLPAPEQALFSELSMGMSEDWPEAVAEGATMVRIGRAIFSDQF